MRVRKIVMVFVLILAMLFVMGCASSKNEGSGSGSGGKTPEWVNKTPAETGETRFFVVSGGKEGSTTQKSFTAQSNAMGELALFVNSKTDVVIKNYLELAGSGSNVQSLQSLRTGIINRATANTSGVKKVEQWVSSDGEYFALFSYNKSTFKSDIKAEVEEFKRNSSAAAANLQADKFFAEMEKDI